MAEHASRFESQADPDADPNAAVDATVDAYRRLVRLTAAGAADTGDVNAALTAALTLAPRLHADLDRHEAALIHKARAAGTHWSDIAAALGLASRQAAQQRYRRLAAVTPATQHTVAVNDVLTDGLSSAETPTGGEPPPDGHGARDHSLDDRNPEDHRASPRTGEDDRYGLVRAEHYPQTGRWLVTIDGHPIGSVAPERRGNTKRWSAWHGCQWPVRVPR